ncbi:MAG: HAD family phosphatase [Gammaproteobacteria bacterium]|nr:HAD family phosphatase [Gammaproteobacteria bacterium]
MIKLAIFDLDGTIVNSMDYWSLTPITYLKRKGVQINSEKEVSDTFLGMSLMEAANYYKNNYGIKDSLDDICGEIDSIMEYYYMNEVDIKSGMRELIESFDKLNIKMAIATATDKYLVKKVLKKLSLDKYFSFIITSNEAGSSKRKPDIYERCSEHFNVSYNDSLILEDLPYGIISGRSIGFKTVGVYDAPSIHHQEQIKKNAHYYVKELNKNTINEILELVKSDNFSL